MNGTTSLTRIDPKVWWTFGISAALALLLLGFKMITYENCDAYQILTNHNQTDKNFTAGTVINFSLNIPNDNAIWDFGDGTEPTAGQQVSHTYFQTGTFTITVSLKGNCRLYDNILIKQLPMPDALSLNEFTGPIFGDSSVPAGTPLTLTSTQNAATYMWTVAHHPEMGVRTERNISYVFNLPGIYDVQLIINNDSSKTFTQKVLVTAPSVSDILNEEVPAALPISGPGPAPLPNIKALKEKESEEQEAETIAKETKAKEKHYQTATDAEMTYLIGDLADGSKSLDFFNNYLCNGANTKVVANGKSTVFADFARTIQDKKGILGLGGKRKIKKVKQTFDGNNGNCVLVLTVDYK